PAVTLGSDGERRSSTMAPERWAASPEAGSDPGGPGTGGSPSAEQMVRGLRATAQGEGLVELLSPEGELTEHPDYPLEVTPELLKGLYRDMVLVRRFDREGNALQRQGQL